MYKILGGSLIMFGLGFIVGMETEKRILAPKRLSKQNEENKVETEKEVEVINRDTDRVAEAEVVE